MRGDFLGYAYRHRHRVRIFDQHSHRLDPNVCTLWPARAPLRPWHVCPCPLRRYHLNTGQRSALVHMYCDGSVGVVHPGCEMGQGLIVKVLQTAAYELSKVRVWVCVGVRVRGGVEV